MGEMAMTRILDWRLRRLRREHGLPDLPEVRAFMRASWLHGFTFGALPSPDRMAERRERALSAVARELSEGNH